jgi:hypothetical protein
MNERILKLAEQAGFYVADGKIYIPSTSEEITTCQKNFAELIVRECIKICSDVEADTEMNLSDGALVCMAEIGEHFGVEE